MSVYLMVEDLHKSFGADELLSGISFGINEGEKIGLIAKNGSGKSTLLRLLAGLDIPDNGTITFRNDLRVGYLPQMPDFGRARTVLDACLHANSPRANALRAYEQAVADGNPQHIAEASDLIDNAHAWDYEAQFKRILTMLKITDLNQPVDSLSGGQAKRVALAQVLLDEPQLLLLDEPTNHLDIEMIEWLENHLRRSSSALLMVTHDRYFLDNICSRIIEIDQHHIYSYDGNYNYYLGKRAERLEAEAAAVERARNLLRTELEWMRRQPQARAHKAQYRIDAFYDLRDRTRTQRNERDLELRTGAATYIGNKIFEARQVCHSFGDKVILDNFTYTFARYERLGIVGDNGVGKTTFINLLLGGLQPDSGTFDIGQTVRFGYYSQEGITFSPEQRVIDAVRDVAEYVVFDDKTQYSAAQLLQMFLFNARDRQKPIAKLSGGERRRLYLATVLMGRPNFLVLDEPTNDLDINTLGVLEDYLAHFKGCLIVISHDRFFMDRTVDHIWVMQGNGVIRDFPGNYSEYRAWLTAHASTAEPNTPKKSSPAERPRTERPKRLSYKQQQELRQLTDEMDALNREKAELDALFSGGTISDDLAAQSARYAALTARLDEVELRWLELNE